MNKATKSSRFVLIGLSVAAIFQLAVLAGELLIAVYPRWTGVPMRVLVEPVDPRDLFRGNYARLGYSFNRVSEDLWQGDDTLRPGQVVYVTLDEKVLDSEVAVSNSTGVVDDENNTDWVASSITLDPPKNARFIRGRVSFYRHSWTQTVEDDDGLEVESIERSGQYDIEYGVEAWFAPKAKAQALERELRNGAWATLYVADSGRAALVDIETERE
jgi:uncharacterized membrane-anchored protein